MLQYRLFLQDDKRIKLYIDKYSGCKIPYISKKITKRQYQNGGFIIIGEVGGIARASSNNDVLILDSGTKIPIYPRGSLLRPLEWVAGYIPLDKDTYAAAVRNFLPGVIFRKINSKKDKIH